MQVAPHCVPSLCCCCLLLFRALQPTNQPTILRQLYSSESAKKGTSWLGYRHPPPDRQSDWQSIVIMSPNSPHGGGSQRLSTRQEATLRALLDAFLPPLVPPPVGSRTTRSVATADQDQAYWTHRLAADPAFLAYLQQHVLTPRHLSSLSWLSTAAGTAWATGRWTDAACLADWPVPQLPVLVGDALQGQQTARLWRSWQRLLCGAAYTYRADPTTAWRPALVTPPTHDRARDAQGVTDGLRRYQGLRQAAVADDDDLECDVLIVGAGAGGATAARVLAEAGYDVVLLEVGPSAYEHVSDFREEAASFLTTTRGSDLLLWTGPAAVGGATRVALGVCQELPAAIRQEWVQTCGLEDFALVDTSAFSEASRVVWDELLHYGDDRPLNQTASTTGGREPSMEAFMKKGCTSLGYRWEPATLCLRDKTSKAAAWAALGDRYLGTKRTALDDLSSPRIRIVTDTRVHRVLLDRSKSLARAVGIACATRGPEGTAGATRTLRARRGVIVAAGALETPCLLKRSGLINRHIGRHLRLHPTTTVFGMAPAALSSSSSSSFDSFRGAAATVLCTEWQEGGDGYGALLHSLVPHPGLVAMLLPWTTPRKFKERMLHLRQTVPIACVQRDSSEGSVQEGRDGSIMVNYELNEKDQASLTKAMQAAVLVQVAAGATEVVSGNTCDTGWVVNDKNSTSLEAYLLSLKNGARGGSYDGNLLSMHQMGSCRMSNNPRSGAVDTNGEAWECNGLYVMDASLFPTAVGVSPMITVMIMARMLALRLANSWRTSDEDTGDSMVALSPGSSSRLQYARHQKLQLLVVRMAKAVVAFLLLIPLFLFWWYDIPCLLA